MAEKIKETTENSEAKTNITVICNTSREDVKGKKPQGIHLNPKFFKQTIRAEVPPRHPPPPPINHDLRMPFNQGPPQPHGFRAFPPRYSQTCRPNEPHDAPFRPNFPPPFQGPRHRSQFFPHQYEFPPPPRFDWQGPPPNFQQDYSQPPPHGHVPYSNEFGSEYVDHNTQLSHPHPPQFQQQYDFSQPPPPIPWQAQVDPIPGPSYYQGFREEYNHANPKWNSANSGMRKYSRSRSRSPSSRRHRSLSRSSGRRSYESGERRSRSLSSDASKGKRRSYDSSSENEDLWDSDVERNSDSDLDLSKPLDSLTSNVSDSKSLLKSALKCLGSAKIQTMIPTELNNISRNTLFHMCADLLEETENEELIHIMEGKVQTKKVQPGDQSLKNTSQSCLSTSSSSKSDVETRQKSHKKKRSKRRKKKRKKKRVSESESSEDDNPDTGTGHEDDSSSENCTDNLEGIVDSTLSDVNKSKSRPSSGTSQSQQSLLELIQIEYKTKAINVMLKNLGVATEISSLVSNVLHTGGISAIQAVTANTDTSMQEEVKEKAESSEAHHVHNVVPDMNSNVTEIDNSSDNSEKKCDTESDTEEEKPQGVSENDTESQNEDCSSTSNCPTLTVTATPSKPENDVTLVEKEIFKEVLDDVLDIGVGDNDEIDFY